MIPSKQNVTWVLACLFAITCLAVGPASQAQVKTKVSKDELVIQDLVDLLAEYPDDARVHYQLAVLLERQDRREEALSHFEEAISLHPEAESYANHYRMTCIWWTEYIRCIEFFTRMVEEHPDSEEMKFHLALAYVDKMPWAKMGMVSQGRLSNQSMAELTKIIEADSSHWAAWYARAMNHLHWPRAMKHAPKSIADFQKAIALQDEMNLEAPKRCFELTYIGLGDAYVKNYEHEKAREAWRQGLELFPRSSQLRKRLSFTDDSKLEEWMKKARALEKQIDTDLSIVWAP